MANPAGESESDAVRVDFNRRLMLQFRGSVPPMPDCSHTAKLKTCLDYRRWRVMSWRRTCVSNGSRGQGRDQWTRLSCRTFSGNAVRLQLHALA
jgi:hypothetical protein